VFTHKGNIRMVSKTMARHYEGNLVGARMWGHYNTLWATPNHPFYSSGPSVKQGVTEKKLDFYPIEQLVTGNYVAVPTYQASGIQNELVIDATKYLGGYEYQEKDGMIKVYSAGNKCNKWIPRYLPVNEAFCKIAGYYLAEGHVDDHQGWRVGWTFHEDEVEFIDEVVQSVKEVFGLDCTIWKCTQSKTKQIKVNSKTLCIVMKNLFGKLAEGKQLADVFLQAPTEMQKIIFDCWANGDGWFGKYETVVVTVSEKLARQMATIALRLGIKYGTRTYPPRSPKHLTKYELSLSGAKNPYYAPKYNEGNLMRSIRSISTKEYNGLVYNLEVEEDNSFIADFVAVHNSVSGDMLSSTNKLLAGIFSADSKQAWLGGLVPILVGFILPGSDVGQNFGGEQVAEDGPIPGLPEKNQGAFDDWIDDISKDITVMKDKNATPTNRTAYTTEISGLTTTADEKSFIEAVNKLVAASNGKYKIGSWKRSNTRQWELYRRALAERGSNTVRGHQVAHPRDATHKGSMHEYGLAVDLAFADTGEVIKGAGAKLAHQLAPKFNLLFPVDGEAWHIQTNTGKEKNYYPPGK
jgi:hypothetical protein